MDYALMIFSNGVYKPMDFDIDIDNDNARIFSPHTEERKEGEQNVA